MHAYSLELASSVGWFHSQIMQLSCVTILEEKVTNNLQQKKKIAFSFMLSEKGRFSSKSIILAGDPAIYEVISSAALCIIYMAIVILPYTRFRNKVPERKSFYIYVLFLIALNALQVIGSVLIFLCVGVGICVVSISQVSETRTNMLLISTWLQLLYFSCYAPVLYLCFLKDFFQKKFYNQFSRDHRIPTTPSFKYDTIN